MQPNLKATYQLTVKGPKDWQFIHNAYPENENTVDTDKTIEFKETALFSTYILVMLQDVQYDVAVIHI